MAKPFEITELLARLQALLRRVPQADLQIFQFGDASWTTGGLK